MEDTSPATERQVKLIEKLYAELRIRNMSLYGGADPAQLTRQGASEVIDVLTLRKLSGQLGRPVIVDLNDPARVREQLARVEQLTDAPHTRHAAATNRNLRHLHDPAESSNGTPRRNQEVAAPHTRTLPHAAGRQPPQPRVELGPEELATRAARLDRDNDGRLDGASRYSDVTGYGSTASYQSDIRRLPSDAPPLTDEQERKIIELQDAGDDDRVTNTVVEANEYLDQVLARPEQPPTRRQLDYLLALEMQAGRTDSELTHPGTRQGASRRIERLLEANAARMELRRDEDLAASLTLAGAASPRTIQDVMAEAAANTERTMPSIEACAERQVSDHDDTPENETERDV